jgi:hypothetical protein
MNPMDPQVIQQLLQLLMQRGGPSLLQSLHMQGPQGIAQLGQAAWDAFIRHARGGVNWPAFTGDANYQPEMMQVLQRMLSGARDAAEIPSISPPSMNALSIMPIPQQLIQQLMQQIQGPQG